MWVVEKWQIWKGISLTKPCWSSINLVCKEPEKAQELCDYLERNTGEPFRIRRQDG